MASRAAIHPLVDTLTRASPRILAPMFEALRTTTVLGLLAAGVPALLTAQAPAPGSVPQAQAAGQAAKPGPEVTSSHAPQFDEKHRPITAGGFVKTGPVVFIDDSEKAGLTRWTHKMGTPEKNYIIETKGSGVGLIDYDNDGWLDIYLVNGSTVDALTGKASPPHAALFHNNHDGTFTEVAAKAGVTNDRWGTGVAIADYDNDGWPDIFVANDTQPNKLYRNLQNGTFVEEALSAGVAFGEDGVARGAMGVDSADYDGSGRAHLIVGNFTNQMLSLYRNEGHGLFVDEAPRSAVGRSSLLSLAFGVFFFDYDLDGWPDIFVGNGHIDEEIGRVQPRIKYAEPPLLFHNVGKGRFEDVSARMGSDLSKPIVARGAAFADFNGDGALDVIVTTNNGPTHLFRNEGNTNGNHWLCVRLQGAKSNRDGIGAVVRVKSPNHSQWQTVHSGSSYASQSDLALTFGLGKDTQVQSVEVQWPSGLNETIRNVRLDKANLIVEGSGTAVVK